MDNINIRCEAIVMNPSSHPLKNLPVTKAEASTIPEVQTSLLLHFCNERWSSPFRRRVFTSSRSSCFKSVIFSSTSVIFSTLSANSSMVRRRLVPVDPLVRINSVAVTGPWTVKPEVNVVGAHGPRSQVLTLEKSTSLPTVSYVE